ncbi:DUF2577 domain-containing protein [Heyndrickxia oleronia]|uniref:DUF2577 domain-containing protein n=1 Tax=Heyndrickxia oleronia TaxID=38875 RepID=UPI0033362E79
MPSLNASMIQIALNAVENSKPAAILFGTVIGTSPLRIDIELKDPLEYEDVILTANVVDHDVDMTVDGIRRKYTVHYGLKTGEKVTLIRQQGGQKYVVLDRVR